MCDVVCLGDSAKLSIGLRTLPCPGCIPFLLLSLSPPAPAGAPPGEYPEIPVTDLMWVAEYRAERSPAQPFEEWIRTKVRGETTTSCYSRIGSSRRFYVASAQRRVQEVDKKAAGTEPEKFLNSKRPGTQEPLPSPPSPASCRQLTSRQACITLQPLQSVSTEFKRRRLCELWSMEGFSVVVTLPKPSVLAGGRKAPPDRMPKAPPKHTGGGGVAEAIQPEGVAVGGRILARQQRP